MKRQTCGAGARGGRAGRALAAARSDARPAHAAARPQFVHDIDNPWFPLQVGSRWTYAGQKDGDASREVINVTPRRKVINGVSCVVVTDVLFVKGRAEERTTDYYAQDKPGNVWYF